MPGPATSTALVTGAQVLWKELLQLLQDKKAIQWGFRGLLPPLSLPIASLSSSGHPCQEAESRTNDDRTEHQALLQRGCLRVGPQPPDSGRFPDNFTGSVWASGSAMQEWSCALCCALSLAALCSKYVISPNLQMRVLEARKDYELTFQVKRGDSESVHLPMRHG